jgi:ADP-ribose pyrophosphatase
MKSNGPWRIKHTEFKYQNPWITVREDQVIRPDGKAGIFGVVNAVGGVSALPIDADDFVYLTQEFRYGIERNSIEAASGGVNRHEAPVDGAKRELAEELGITAETWTELGQVDPLTSVIVSPQRLFLAQNLSFSKATPEGTELITTIRIKLEAALKLVDSGKITHAPTCVLILKAARLLSKPAA